MNFLTPYYETLASRLGMTLTHSLWQGAIVAISLALALRLMTKASSAWRYAVCCGAMVSFVVTVACTFAALQPAQPLPMLVMDSSVTPVDAPIVLAVTLPPMIQAPPSNPGIDPMRWAGCAWLVGAIVVTLWHLAGWVWLRRSVRGRELDVRPLADLREALGIRRVVRLVESSRLNVPAVVGVIRPVILIPLGLLNDLAPDQIEAILLHELAHIRRHDYLVNLIQIVVDSLLFYHPATWWISSQIRREREHCCDDIAASRFTPTNYVTALLALEQRRWPTSSALVAATGGTLLERVQRLLGHRSSAKPRPFRSAIAAMIALSCILTPVLMNGCNKSSTGSSSTTEPVAGDVKPTGIIDDDFKPDYSIERLGPGDLVQVSINDLVGVGVETTKQVRVADPEGTINLPLVGSIKVAGMTEAEAQRKIVDAYKVAQVINNATVSVSRIVAQSTSFTALGEFGKPGAFAMTAPDYRLTSALADADAHFSGQKILVLIRKNGASTRTLNISVADLIAGDPHVNVVMRPGDVVILPPSDKPVAAATSPATPTTSNQGAYFIGGTSIKRVGVYQYSQGITLKQAIIAAGGLEDGYICVFRRDGAAESIVAINLRYADLASGASNDLSLHPGDTIMVNPAPQGRKNATTRQVITP